MPEDRRCKAIKEKACLSGKPTDSLGASPIPSRLPCPIDPLEKDQLVFLTAIAIGADSFLTGDITHFGKYRGKPLSGVKILRHRDYLKKREPK
ncbi:MAG: hypothetical protein ABH852_00195 [Methanobacteriota archaeon]